jgi:sulfide:quinone oxidoreductase
MVDPGERFRVLIAGGGVAALEAMVALRKLAEDRVEIELLSPDTDFFYRPLSVAEPFGLGEVHRFDLVGLARGCGATHRLGSLLAVDPDERSVRTSRNAIFSYDALLLAIGVRPREAVPGALTFRGEMDIGLVRRLLSDLESGFVRNVVFALPGGVTWPLPLYELALMTADHLARQGISDAELRIVTPEDSPLSLLGPAASDAVAAQLEERGVELHTGTHPGTFHDGRLSVVPDDSMAADVVVSLPRLRGIPLAGVPQDADFFVPTDSVGRVAGLENVFAAGDLTTFPVKQGGLAAQQADIAAESIAALAGAPVTPTPFEPVLRALLLSDSPIYLRAQLGGGHGETSTVDEDALWWPAGKIAARHLGPYLADHVGLSYGLAGRSGSLL